MNVVVAVAVVLVEAVVSTTEEIGYLPVVYRMCLIKEATKDSADSAVAAVGIDSYKTRVLIPKDGLAMILMMR